MFLSAHQIKTKSTCNVSYFLVNVWIKCITTGVADVATITIWFSVVITHWIVQLGRGLTETNPYTPSAMPNPTRGRKVGWPTHWHLPYFLRPSLPTPLLKLWHIFKLWLHFDRNYKPVEVSWLQSCTVVTAIAVTKSVHSPDTQTHKVKNNTSVAVVAGNNFIRLQKPACTNILANLETSKMGRISKPMRGGGSRFPSPQKKNIFLCFPAFWWFLKNGNNKIISTLQQYFFLGLHLISLLILRKEKLNNLPLWLELDRISGIN